MNAPEVRKVGDVIQLSWPEGVTIDACRLHDGREGLTGELTIGASLPGLLSPHLAFGRTNLTSFPARKTLAALLEERCNGAPVNWPQILEEAAILVVRAMREGEPFVTLGQGERPAPQPWLVDGFLRMGEHSVLFGFKATLKSLLALAFSCDVATGEVRLGRAVQPGPVLFLDYETDAATAEERLWLLASGRGDARPPAVFYRRMARPLAEDVTAVQRMRDREGAVLTIVDSQGLAIGQSSSGHDPAASVLTFYAAAREVGGTILGIDHRPHDDGGRGKPSPYGSIYKANCARSLWLAKTSQEPGASDVHVGLFHQLANNYGLQRPIGFHVTFSEDAVTITPEDARDVPLLREGLSATERCWLALEQPASTALLAEETGLKPNTVRQACGRHPGIQKIGHDGRDATWARVSTRDGVP
jgi:hypothetical protein